MPTASTSRTSSLAEQILIVPLAHTRVTDIAFQAEMYELFHRTAPGRIGHMIGTPTVLFGALTALTFAPSAAAPVLATALVVGVSLWGLAVDRLAGVLTVVATGALAGGAFALARAVRPEIAFAVALACVFGGCAVQTFSHMFEDVPPPTSGTEGFVPMTAWLRRIRALDALRATLLTLGVFYWLEMWAAFRILPLQILHLLMKAGYRPELRRALDARVAAILASPASDWKRPAAIAAGSVGSAS